MLIALSCWVASRPRASGINNINTGPSPKPLSDSQLLPQVLEILVPQDWSLHVFQQVTDGVHVGVAQPEAPDMGQDGSLVGQAGPPLGWTPLGKGQGPLSSLHCEGCKRL